MLIDADTALIEAARRLAPVIREHQAAAERERRLSPSVLAALHEAGLLRLCTPRSLGGLEGDPLTRALVIEELSEHDTAARGESALLMAYLPRESCRVLDTWHVLGMRGTGSHDVAVSDVFVPTARTFPFVPEFTPGAHYRGPLYRFPLIGMAASALPPVLLAVARQAIAEVSALACGKVPVAARTVLRDRAAAQAKLARAEALLRAGRTWLYDTLSEAWAAIVAGETLSLKHKADMLLAMTYAVQSAVQVVELMYSVAGTSGISTQSPLERYFRDAQVLRHHVVAAETRYETVGQVYLRLPPDFPALEF
jgi:alkylation response protein AidB-like acyl-CoA dehydrogenase